MRTIIKLTNEESIGLYNFLQNLKLERSKNRNRWKFLEVIEDKIFDYEKLINDKNDEMTIKRQELANSETSQSLSIQDKTKKRVETNADIKRITKEMEDLSKVVNTFEFNDREIYAQGKNIFETVTEELTGRQGKVFKKIEDAFLVEEKIEDQPKK